MRRSAVITGGAGGIGVATAIALNRDGFDLTIVGRRVEASPKPLTRSRGRAAGRRSPPTPPTSRSRTPPPR